MKKIIFSILLIACVNLIAWSDEYSFKVKVSGKGKTPVILIPGFSCSGDVWNETAEKIGSDHTCYMLTMPGFAGVPAQKDPRVENWVSEIAKYIKDEKLEKPIIIGHSLGGVMSLWLAADHPELVSKIIVVDALPCLPGLSNPSFKVNSSPDCSVIKTSYVSMGEEQFLHMQKMSIASLSTDTAMIPTVVNWGVRSDRNTLAEVYCQLMNTDLRPKLSSIKCPALIMLESNFKSLHTAMEAQYKDLAGAQLKYADKGLHFIMYDDREWYFPQLSAFIK